MVRTSHGRGLCHPRPCVLTTRHSDLLCPRQVSGLATAVNHQCKGKGTTATTLWGLWGGMQAVCVRHWGRGPWGTVGQTVEDRTVGGWGDWGEGLFGRLCGTCGRGMVWCWCGQCPGTDNGGLLPPEAKPHEQPLIPQSPRGSQGRAVYLAEGGVIGWGGSMSTWY